MHTTKSSDTSPTHVRMPRALCTVLAIVVGFVVVVIGTLIIDQLGLWLWPLPAGMKMGETSMADVMASRPIAALAFNALLRLPMIVCGAFLAGKLVPTHPKQNGFIVGVMFLAFALGPAFIIHMPAWFIVTSILVMPLCGYVGGRLAMQNNVSRH